MGSVARMIWSPKYDRRSAEPIESCEACAALREALRICLGVLSKCYGDELERNDPNEMSVTQLVQGGVVLRAERALRLECSCGH